MALAVLALTVVVFGAGRLSIDAVIERRLRIAGEAHSPRTPHAEGAAVG
jgi:hypothetical protein